VEAILPSKVCIDIMPKAIAKFWGDAVKFPAFATPVPMTIAIIQLEATIAVVIAGSSDSFVVFSV
jgi:hypothetical protein